ncbi:hypothetical protein [Streptomyces xanthochromogenes]|uniref:Transposase n=1 Tax=Streptomyces xanthochromogenes TaxID=67384 RepID=A0ABQ3ATI2_9ACTN|nr:hypothetical protein [Streptomyces xanthochromogenes]GGY65462.1 hypothetical protein GCM10010326_70060 [Streptomyces xanthochromogenes]
MYRVSRTRLDTTAPAVARKTADHTEIVLDDRDISPAGASALERLLNAIHPRRGTGKSESEYPQQPEQDTTKHAG